MKRKSLIGTLLGILLILGLLFSACGQEKATQKVKVETNGVPAGAFEIVAPALNAEDANINPHIFWTAERNAESYLVSLSKTADFNVICAEERTSNTDVTIGTTLDYSTKYYVRIFAMKNDGGKSVALSYASSVFTTLADHETPVPDNSVTRVIHDFEDFEDDYELNEFFKTHTGGDPLVPTLAEGEGVDSSTAMRLTYTPEGKGWAAVSSINKPDKKNWSGATGIRMWVNSAGNGGTFKVSIGKRGYQRWTASVVLNKEEPGYLSIPFSAFEDSGGGDGVWDMTGIVRLWFYFSSKSEADVLIDDVTIGSDELHSTDNRDEFANPAQPPREDAGIFEDFENTTIEQVRPKWNIQGKAEPSIVNTSGNSEMKLYAQEAFTMQASGYNIGDFDLSQANGFRMKIRINPAKAATVVVKIGSYLNAYTMEKNFYDQNTSVYMVCDFAGMKLADDGSTGELDKTKINFLQISVKNFTAPLDVYIDELEFYTDENGAMGSAFVSDFSDESTQNWGNAVIENGTATVSNETAVSLQYKNESWVNYQNTYAIRFKVNTENVKSISARVLDASANGIKKAVNFTQDGEYEFILYYNQMEMHGTKPHVSMKFYYIQFYVTFNAGGGSAQFSNVELLIG